MVDLALLGQRLDSVLLEVFSNLNNAVILWRCDLLPRTALEGTSGQAS